MTVRKFQLDTSQRTKLIEILLIVGSIVAAFKMPTKMIWLFMLFFLCSILYYIIIQKETGDTTPPPFLAVISIVISASFVGIIVFNFALSLFEALSGFSLVIVALTIIYYIVFTIIIYKALMGK